MSNRIISTLTALSDNAFINPNDRNNVVCIDTSNNRIGVKKADPDYEIDVSGTINTIKLQSYEISGNIITNKIDSSNSLTITASNNLIIDASLGIGTLDPSYTIDVSGDGHFSQNVIMDSILGIGIENPGYTLDVSGDGHFSQNVIMDSILGIGVTNPRYTIHVNGTGRFSQNVIIDASLGIGTDSPEHSLDISGDIKCTGVVINDGNELSSDDRLKHNEKKIVNGLEIIRQLEPQVYQKTKTLKKADFSGILTEPYIMEAGVIAQDILKIDDLSYSVTGGDISDNFNKIIKKPYYLNYNNIFVYGLAAIKELDSKMDNLNTYLINNNLIKDTNTLLHGNTENINKLITNQIGIIANLNNKIKLLETKVDSLEKELKN